ncbi:MAG: hypothetical protein QOD86_955 [Miltoncostaeaceae bacterium]|jgi:regulator of protease activity HflC (stomatin/prohibitin superfamily)|nr:hypothetical protein [Miltoncostaeaceae bacterium]
MEKPKLKLKAPSKGLPIAGGVIGFIVLLIVVIGGTFHAPPAQKISVVRNGGPFDNHNIREIVVPGSGKSWVGMFSDVRSYPDRTIQRFYTISHEQGEGFAPVSVPTKDGVKVAVEGTLYFNTVFDGSAEGQEAVGDFDNQFGTRTFARVGGGDPMHPYDGDNGWLAFLNAIVKPVVDSELRASIGTFNCSQLIASCSLAANVSPSGGGDNTALNVERVQDDLNERVAKAINTTLGHEYFVNYQFRLAAITPPEAVQTSIDRVQAARAQVSEAQAQVQRARLEAEANRERASVYRDCPACAAIDQLREAKNLPAGTNIYIGIDPVIPTR